MKDTMRMIPQLVKRLNLAFERDMSRCMLDQELTPAQASALGYIIERIAAGDTLHARDVESGLRLSHATTAGLLARLAAKGFLTFERCETDSRMKVIRLTDKCRAQDAVLRRRMLELEDGLLRALTPQEREQFRALLLRLIEAVET